MILPDVNVLVYAFRADTAQHAVCRAWLNEIIQGEAQFGISRLVLGALIRVTTSSRIYRAPSSFADAFGFCEDILSQRHCHPVEPGERHWDIFQRLCIETNTRGPDVTDAWYAALAMEWGCEWITTDRDFARFSGLKWRAPAAA